MRSREFFRITKYARRYDRNAGKFLINIAYKTRTDVTDRTVAVAEAFGLGVDEHREHVVYDDVELKIGPQDIVYVTGDSGSGKSVLLDAIVRDLNPLETARMSDVEIDPKKPLIDTVGRSINEGLKLLSKVGLNDAFLFVRRYTQLSEGQRYRYRVAKLIESGAQWWIMDEFCSRLDRDTARIVAFNVQKLARKEGKAVVAATTHADLFEDLRPSVHIHKRFGKEIHVEYCTNELNQECSLVQEIRVEEGDLEDYKQLVQFHYRQGGHPPLRKVFRMKRKDELVGVILYCYPPITLIGRKKVFRRKFTPQEVNKKFAIISRVVVHPKYRTIGLGVKLVKETMPLVELPFIEAIAVMAQYNPFFEKAGMTKIMERFPSHNILDAIENLRELGFNPMLLGSTKYNLERLKRMNRKELKACKEILTSVRNPRLKKFADSHAPYGTQAEYRQAVNKALPKKVAKMLKALSFLAQTKVYLLWKKP
jgi:ABC-type ATPase with predicted acetyltransferase domain